MVTVLRDPVERAISHANYVRRNELTTNFVQAFMGNKKAAEELQRVEYNFTRYLESNLPVNVTQILRY